jgi:hypothetical protein
MLLVGCQPPSPSDADGTVTKADIGPGQPVLCPFINPQGNIQYSRACFAGQVPGDPGPPSNLPPPNRQLECPPGKVVTGIYGRSGSYIDRIGIDCADVLADGTLSAPTGGDWVGGNGGGYFDDIDHSCPAGWAAAGIYGHAGAYIDSIGLTCVPAPFTRDLSSQQAPRAGGNGGSPYQVNCQTTSLAGGNHDLITGLRVWYGDYIDALAPECATPFKAH